MGVPNIIENLENLKTDLENLKTFQSNIFNTIYPVGSIYISINSVNPASIFGGTWEQIQGRFLLGASSSYAAGTTGGEATHTLTANEMPSHAHAIYMGTGTLNPTGYWGVYSVLELKNTSASYTAYTGGNAAHNNMPPYLIVYIWKRIS